MSEMFWIGQGHIAMGLLLLAMGQPSSALWSITGMILVITACVRDAYELLKARKKD